MTEPDKEFWTIDELAAYLGESVHHVQELEHDKKLPSAMRFGDVTHWRSADVKQWLEDHRGRAH
jgi:excisionase family DNA binding protein